MHIKHMQYTIFIALILVLFSCGNSDVSCPPESEIVISPDSVTVTDARGEVDTYTQNFTIHVQDSAGVPIREAEVNLSYLWAVPAADAVVQLYDDETAVNSPFVATTDEFGVYYLRFDFQSGGGLTYSADLEARCGEVYGSANFEVAAE